MGQSQNLNVLQLLQRSLSDSYDLSNQQRSSHDSSDSSDMHNFDNNHDSLTSNEMIIQKLASKDSVKNTKHNLHTDKIERFEPFNKNNEKLLKQILSKVYDIKTGTQKYNKKLLTPNRLLVKSFEYENEMKHEAVGNLDDYSKIYIILNPEAMQKSRNKNSFNNLLSKLLSISPTPGQRDLHEKVPQHHYKSFPVKKDIILRRAKRDSREMFAPKDSDEDYKQKRNRNDGGGGGGFRTAIPYIGHRGDIYERDR